MSTFSNAGTAGAAVNDRSWIRAVKASKFNQSAQPQTQSQWNSNMTAPPTNAARSTPSAIAQSIANSTDLLDSIEQLFKCIDPSYAHQRSANAFAIAAAQSKSNSHDVNSIWPESIAFSDRPAIAASVIAELLPVLHSCHSAWLTILSTHEHLRRIAPDVTQKIVAYINQQTEVNSSALSQHTSTHFDLTSSILSQTQSHTRTLTDVNRHNYRLPIEASIFNNRELCRDAFSAWRRDQYVTESDFRSASTQFLQLLMPANRIWFAFELFVPQLIETVYALPLLRQSQSISPHRLTAEQETFWLFLAISDCFSLMTDVADSLQSQILQLNRCFQHPSTVSVISRQAVARAQNETVQKLRLCMTFLARTTLISRLPLASAAHQSNSVVLTQYLESLTGINVNRFVDCRSMIKSALSNYQLITSIVCTSAFQRAAMTFDASLRPTKDMQQLLQLIRLIHPAVSLTESSTAPLCNLSARLFMRLEMQDLAKAARSDTVIHSDDQLLQSIRTHLHAVQLEIETCRALIADLFPRVDVITANLRASAAAVVAADSASESISIQSTAAIHENEVKQLVPRRVNLLQPQHKSAAASASHVSPNEPTISHQAATASQIASTPAASVPVVPVPVAQPDWRALMRKSFLQQHTDYSVSISQCINILAPHAMKAALKAAETELLPIDQMTQDAFMLWQSQFPSTSMEGSTAPTAAPSATIVDEAAALASLESRIMQDHLATYHPRLSRSAIDYIRPRLSASLTSLSCSSTHPLVITEAIAIAQSLASESLTALQKTAVQQQMRQRIKHAWRNCKLTQGKQLRNGNAFNPSAMLSDDLEFVKFCASALSEIQTCFNQLRDTQVSTEQVAVNMSQLTSSMLHAEIIQIEEFLLQELQSSTLNSKSNNSDLTNLLQLLSCISRFVALHHKQTTIDVNAQTQRNYHVAHFEALRLKMDAAVKHIIRQLDHKLRQLSNSESVRNQIQIIQQNLRA